MSAAERVITHVLIEPDALTDLIMAAYIAGATDVHKVWSEDEHPEFTEAAYDYVASLDFTETTRPAPAGDRS